MLLASIRRFNPGVRSVLDYGCGDGHFVRDATSCGLDANGTDFADRRQSNVEAVGATWIETDKIIHGEHVFDSIELLQVFEHLANPDQLLSGLGKVLAPCGVVLIETPCTNGPDDRIFGISLWGGLHSPRQYFIPSFVVPED
jgi:2-polyprenyl-3-methyl-5-hydroxy-6-metoxy-1,4-benzoquinol methylase